MIVANKADKIAVTKVDGRVAELQSILNPLKDLTFLPFSSERKVYTEEIMKKLEETLLN
jgi:GTP-binding protein EngB required for normal cell division